MRYLESTCETVILDKKRKIQIVVGKKPDFEIRVTFVNMEYNIISIILAQRKWQVAVTRTHFNSHYPKKVGILLWWGEI